MHRNRSTAPTRHLGAEIDVTLTPLEQRRLIAALLPHRHLILSDPAEIGKGRLIHTLAVTQGKRRNIQEIPGHPWWYAR